MGASIIPSTAGTMMFFYSFLLIAMNRKLLPPIRIGRLRTAALIWSTLMFGSLAVLNAYTQAQNLLR